ncbi:short-chain dehydrogenase [Leptospira kobayashii]|uniref:Short-chain dehydrogenase n=1 Tax=Leptospira kobayashii TaxID=1917830 RepID=A0ABM7UH73_9LEPT|nr:SDR family NAD(P)-dependent oxidoreductase [Leptospira kobayashii]BDA77975.1 short-chain dehydrogenase [Leptospira kobayashii]
MNRNVFITGASSGLGKETCIYFAEAGWNVFAGSRKTEDLKEIANYKNVKPVRIDLEDGESVKEAAKYVEKECGDSGLAVVIHNAGSIFFSPYEYMEESSARNLFEVLFWGPFALTRLLLPSLKKYKAQTDQNAKVLNVLSRAAWNSDPWTAIYAAAKAALLRLNDTQYLELKSSGIDVTSVIPGLIDTPFIGKSVSMIKQALFEIPEEGKKHYLEPMTRLAKISEATAKKHMGTPPSFIAKKIVKIAESKTTEISYHFGTDTFIYSLLNRFLPRTVPVWMTKKIFGL